MSVRWMRALGCGLGLWGVLSLGGVLREPQTQEAPSAKAGPERVEVPKELIGFDDGDSIAIRWNEKRTETVRILGIDTPEVLHLDHGIPYPQPFGPEAAAFLHGCILGATKVELLRSGQKDPFGRTLGYVFVDGKNYSVLAIQARFAVETVSHYGDNGLPKPAAACLAAAKKAGPVAFEAPYLYRKRMRKVTAWMKEQGTYPKASAPR